MVETNQALLTSLRSQSMRQLTSIVTALLLVAHATIGCCAHHACGAGGECSHNHVVADEHLQCSADGFVGLAVYEAAHDNAPQKSCDHGKCTYVGANSKQVDRDGQPCIDATASLPTTARGTLFVASAAVQTTFHAGCMPFYVCYCALLI